MASSIVADFVVNDDGDLIGYPRHTIIDFPPVFPTDIASKGYVDASFPDGGSTGGSYYRGMLNFSTIDTPLYGATGADSVEFTVNRVGNMVTLNMSSLNTHTTAAGYTLVASGLPKEYWPLPYGYVLDDSVATGCVVLSQLGTVPGVTSETSNFGVGSNGIIRITTIHAFGIGGACQWYGGALTYLTTNVAV